MIAAAAPASGPSGRVKFLLVVAFLVLCVASLQVMPVLTPWGADLQNLQAYARCAADATTHGVSQRGPVN